jgi:4-amino-4-deoxy-L-arabinose transferase-like glycosyltransferase
MDNESASRTFGLASFRSAFRSWHAILLATFAVGAFSIFFRLGESKSLGSHEGYAIVPAREMLLTGDYVVPRFGGMPRLQKPPLIYWSILAAANVTGTLDITTARLPAAIAGMLLGALICAWGYRWYGRAGAIGALAAQLTSVYVLVFARKAEADLILVLLIATALAMLVGYREGESKRRTFARWTGIWACAAVTWLGKFHFGPAMIFGPVVCWLCLERRWRLLLGIFNPVGILMFAAAAGIWPAMILERVPHAWEIWQEETIGRAVGELGHQPFWYYLPHLATWTLPWTLFAVLAWPASWTFAFPRLRHELESLRRGASPLLARLNAAWDRVIRNGDPRERFLWVWLAVTLAMVTVSANKHPHYILPALPAFSLWTGRRFCQLAEQARRGERLIPLPLAIAVSVLAGGFAGALIAFPGTAPFENALLSTLAPLIVVAIAAAGWLLWCRRPRTAAFVLLGVWVVAYGTATKLIVPAEDHRAGAYAFAEAVRARYGDEAPIGIYGMHQDAAVWHLGEPVFRAERPEQVAERLKTAGRLRLLTMEAHKRSLAELGELTVVEQFQDQPGLPPVELDHYRQMVLVELVHPLTAGQAVRRD